MCAIRRQTEALIVLDDLVPKDHPFRDRERVIDIRALAKPLDALYSDLGRRETGAERGLRMLVLQFMLDLSDREMERFMHDNAAARRFRGFGPWRGRPTIPGSASSVRASGPRASWTSSPS